MKRTSAIGDLEGALSGSKKKKKLSASEDDDSRVVIKIEPNDEISISEGFHSAPKGHSSPSLSKIYNSSYNKNKPAELFRKDLISAMKLPDSEQLDADEFWYVSDSWKQEWERGVQVPVNSKALPETNIRPKKFIRLVQDSSFSSEHHILSNVATQAEKVCRYDMDDLDCHWLNLLNEQREDLGLPRIEEKTMELILEDFETQCFDRFQEALKTQEGLGIEYDEDVICDVCRSPDSEEGNEMVFCDSCNICVHQACYGITSIPEGSWVCRTCALAVHPPCILCPNTGGAMKSTRSGQKWAHVSCALWIPEVSIGCAEKMEPITKISQIPASRWALICNLCRERIGACIQCSVKQCKVAYHVTCAFKHGLEMKAIFDESNEEDGVKLRSYCLKHSKKQDELCSSDSDCIDWKIRNKKIKKEVKESKISKEDKYNARLQRIRMMESEFFKHVNPKDTVDHCGADPKIVDFMFQYWKLKRTANFNKALLTPKAEESDLLGRQQEDSLYARMKMFVHLRQDLERVRNLCYMVSRREKLFRTWVKIKEEVFQKQAEIVSDVSVQLSDKDIEAVIQAGHGTTIYDEIYSANSNIDLKDSDSFMDCDTEKDKAFKNSKKGKSTSQRLPNPYAKCYLNGIYTRSRRQVSLQETNLEDNSNCTETLVKHSEHNNISSGIKSHSNENFNKTCAVETNIEKPNVYVPVVIKVELMPALDSSDHFSDNKSAVHINTSDEAREKYDNKDEKDSIEESGINFEMQKSESENLNDINPKKDANDKFANKEKHGSRESSQSDFNNLKENKNANKDTVVIKNSLSSNDKENIVMHLKNKVKKGKTHIEVKSKDFVKGNNDSNIDKESEKNFYVLDACNGDKINGISVENFENQMHSESEESKINSHNTRYQMRTRNQSSGSQQEKRLNKVSVAIGKCQISDKDGDDNLMSFLTNPSEIFPASSQEFSEIVSDQPSLNRHSVEPSVETCEVKSDELSFINKESSFRVQRRPSKSIWSEKLNKAKVLTKEMGEEDISEKQMLLNKELSPEDKLMQQTSRIKPHNNNTKRRMSLRHSGKDNVSQTLNEQKLDISEKSLSVTLEVIDSVLQLPTTESTKNAVTDNSSDKDESEYLLTPFQDSECPTYWDCEELPQAHILNDIDQSASPRLVIRLRKDPECQRWQKDTDIADTPAAFRVVRNDWDISTEKMLHEITLKKPYNNLSPQTFSDKEASKENGHRYSMRMRSSSQKNSKYGIVIS